MSGAVGAAAVVVAVFGLAWWLAPGGAARLSASPRGRSRPRLLGPIAVVTGVVAAVAALGPASLVWSAGAAGAAIAISAIARMRRRSVLAAARRAQVIELCDALTAELAGGVPLSAALARACEPVPQWAAVVAVDRLGGDPVEGLRACAAEPGASGLGAIAAGWSLARETGAPLAEVLDRVGSGLRDAEAAHDEVVAALGPPRATARLLAGLPVFGVLLGISMDADPIGFLIGTNAGRFCLAGGVALALLGLAWVERLAAAAELG